MCNKKTSQGVIIAEGAARFFSEKKIHTKNNNEDDNIYSDKASKFLEDFNKIINNDKFIEEIKSNENLHSNLKELVIKTFKIMF